MTGARLPLPDPMRRALELAQEAALMGEVPVGAVVVCAGQIVGEGYNLTRTGKDPTAHAEVVAIRKAATALDDERLTQCDLYVTLEPCAMCAAAISFARIRRLYFAAGDPKGGGVIHGGRFFSAPTCHHAPEVYSGFSETEAAALLKDFFRDRRREG